MVRTVPRAVPGRTRQLDEGHSLSATTPYAGANQAHKDPAGPPPAGQFSTRIRADPNVAMKDLSDEQYNTDGSYTYPPHPRNAAQHIAFWMSVPLPEEKLETLSRRYREVRESLGATEGVKAAEAFELKHRDLAAMEHSKDPKKQTKFQAFKAQQLKLFDAAVEDRVGHMPERIYRTGARPILRAHQMYTYRLPLSDEDRKRVCDFEMQVDGVTMTVERIVKLYELERISGELI